MGQGKKWGQGGPGGNGPLIGSMGLVWRGACNCAQRATTPIKGLFSLIELCLPSIMCVYVLYAFFFSTGQKINYVSENEHAFILGCVRTLASTKFLSLFFTKWCYKNKFVKHCLYSFLEMFYSKLEITNSPIFLLNI